MSKLKGTRDSDKAFRELLFTVEPEKEDYTTWSGRKPFSKEYELLAPSVVTQQWHTGLVGTAFDYLARLRLAQLVKQEEVLYGMAWIQMFNRLAGVPAFDRGVGERWITQLKAFIKKPDAPISDILELSVRMAKLDQLYRIGSRGEDADAHYILVAPAPAEVLVDLTQLMAVFEQRFIPHLKLKKKSQIVFNPHFGVVSELMGGADGDVFIDGTLFDFKTGKNPGWNRKDNQQMTGYFLLNQFESVLNADNYGFHTSGIDIKRIAVYKARFGEVEQCEIQALFPYAVMKPTLSALAEHLKDRETMLRVPMFSDPQELRKHLEWIRMELNTQ